MTDRPYRKFSETGIPERENPHLKRVLLVAQILDAERSWMTSKDVHRAYVERVGEACRRSIRRDLQALVCTGVAEARQRQNWRCPPHLEFKFDGWPLPLGG